MKVNNASVQGTVLECTERLLKTQGIKGWTMDTVALEAGMAKNTLYKIIGTKEQLVEKIVIGRLRGNVDAIVGIFRHEGDFIPAVEKSARQLSQSIGRNDLRILPSIFREYPSIKKKFDSISGTLSTSIHGYLNRAKKSGILRKDIDNDILIGSVTAIINYFLSGKIMERDFEKRLYTAFMYLLRGILK